MNCVVAMVFALVVVPATAMGSPGIAESAGDGTTLELGADLAFLDDEEYGAGNCGFAVRLGYRWRDYLLLEGEYSHYGDPADANDRFLFLAAAGPRVGFRKRGLGWFIKLHPGIVHDPSFSELKFALSVGGVMEAHLVTVGKETPTYFRFDMGYLIIPNGDGILNRTVAQHPGTVYPRSSIGIVFRF